MSTAPSADMVQEAVNELQIRVWDRADDPRFVLTIYEPQRQGWKVGSVGGLEFLDYTGAYAGLGPEHSVLEFGSGMGDACAYIASRFGSRVTGVELGTQQIERARERHGDPQSRRYDFVQADFLQWDAPERYDAIYFLEMLPIIHDCPTLLEKMHGLLKPSGSLTMSDIIAGPGLTAENREFLWVEDGVVHNLPILEERVAMLRDLGFQDIEVTDITPKALRQQDIILEESERHKETIVEGVGIDSWLNWVECANVYGSFFNERKLECVMIGARRES